METNFFNQIQQLEFTGVLQLNISKGVENNLIVSVMLNNDECGDNAKNLIPPLTFNATPQEFDEGFFEQITTPIQTISGVMVDMEKFLKQMEEVKKQSAMQKTQTDKAKAVVTDRNKKYEEALRKSEELEKQGKYRAAWSALPEPATLTQEHADAVRKRRSALSAKFEPDLFAAPVETNVTTTNEETVSGDYIEDSIEEMYQQPDVEEDTPDFINH